MAQGEDVAGAGRQAASGELALGMVFVPEGEAPPAEVLAGDWVRLPARRVPRGDGAPPLRQGVMSRLQRPGRPPAHPGGLGAGADAPATDAQAVAAWREMDGVFADPAGATGMQQLVADRTGDSASSVSARIADMSDEEYGQGKDVVLPDGSFVDDPDSPTGHMQAPVTTLDSVAQAGRAAGKMNQPMLANPETVDSAVLYSAGGLGAAVGQGGVFDYQRRGNMLLGYSQFRGYKHASNFNVGLFCQQSGMSLEDTLYIAGKFASVRSANSDPTQPYGLNPEVRDFITRGFEAGESRVFGSDEK